jgi:hypothetical protein
MSRVMREASEHMPPPESSVDSINELALDARRKKRRMLLVLFGVIPVALAVLGVAWWYFGNKAADEAINGAWDTASACLVGAPLAEGEKASLRMRAIQLVAVHAERDRKTDTRWPARCADQVALLFEALREHGRTGDGDDSLAARAEPFAVQLRKAEVMHDLSIDVDGLYEAAAKMGLKAKQVGLQLPTPEPSKGFNLDTLPETAQLSPLQYTLDNVTSTPHIGTEIHALVYDKKVDEKPLLCTFNKAGTDKCRQLGGELVGKSGLRLGGTADAGATPLALAGRRGLDGVYRTDGTFEQIVAMQVQSAYVAKDGYVAITSFSKKGKKGSFDLVQQAAPEAPSTTIEVDADMIGGDAYEIHRKALLWGKLMVQVFYGNDADYTVKLLYADLPVHGDTPKFAEVAEINWINARIFGCQTPTSVVVGVGDRRGFLTFYEGEKWSKPVHVEELSNVFGCHSGEIVFTSALGNQQRCTPAGCESTRGVSSTFEPFQAKEAYWTDLNGKVLNVASTDRRGAVRYRFSAGKNLGDVGTDLVLFDDLIRGGQLQQNSTLLGLLLAGRSTYAVSLLTTPNGVYAIRFDADGIPKPAKISR